MPTLPPRVAAVVLAGVAAGLLVAALLLQGASARLLTPLPGLGVALGVGLWLSMSVPLVYLVSCLAVPRLARRLLVGAVIALAGWGLGTIVRGGFVVLLFLVAGVAERGTEVFEVLPQGGTGSARGADVPVMSFERRKTVWVPFTGDAVAELGRGFVCVELVIERTTSGVERLVLPSEPLGVDELQSCP